jgi:hypothetical protein
MTSKTEDNTQSFTFELGKLGSGKTLTVQARNIKAAIKAARLKTSEALCWVEDYRHDIPRDHS